MSAFCEPATTTSTPQSSWRSSAAPRPETASTTRMTSCRRATSAIACTSWTMPVEVSDSVANATFTSVFSPSSRSISRGIEALAPAGLVAHELGAVGLAELDPALAELAGRAREHLVARADEVGDRGLHRARAAGREREHLVLRPEDHRQLVQHALVELVEGGRAVVEHRRRHRLRDRRRDRRRPGGHQVLLGERIWSHGGDQVVGRAAQRSGRARPKRRSSCAAARGRAPGRAGTPRSRSRSRSGPPSRRSRRPRRRRR